MTKSLYLFLFLVLSYMTIHAQTFPSYVGIKGGISTSKITGTNVQQFPLNSNYSNRQGMDLELFIETKVSKILTFQSLGLELSSQGGIKNGLQAFLTTSKYASFFQPGQVPKYLYADFKKETKLNYLMSTTILKVGSNTDKKTFIKFYIGVGYYLAFLLSAKEITKGTSIVYVDNQSNQSLSSTSDAFNNTKDIKADLHKFNIGICGNIGISFPIGKNKVFLEGYGNYGLININKKSENGKNFIEAGVVRIGFAYNIGQVFPKLFQIEK